MFSDEAVEAARLCIQTSGCTGIIGFAAQIGRLDLVSLLLAILGILLALGGVVAFLNFRSLARKQAREEAEKIAKVVAEEKANEYLQTELMNIIREYKSFIDDALNDPRKSDDIAKMQEDGSQR